MTKLVIAERAHETLTELEKDPAQKARYRKVARTLGILQVNRQHPGLQAHKLKSITHSMPDGSAVDIWEAYVENNTPGAWRIFYHLGTKDTVTVIAIRQHL